MLMLRKEVHLHALTSECLHFASALYTRRGLTQIAFDMLDVHPDTAIEMTFAISFQISHTHTSFRSHALLKKTLVNSFQDVIHTTDLSGKPTRATSSAKSKPK
jgi:hypothetical protein